MMRPCTFSFVAALLGGAMALATPAQAQTVYVLLPSTDTPTFNLGSFEATAPGTFVNTPGYIRGLGSMLLAGIEVRPATGQLYALGYTSSTQQTQLFVVNPTTAMATAVGPALALNLGGSLSNIGFSFDPGTDLVRVVSAFGTNYRLAPGTGALVATDAPLAYASTDANAGQSATIGAIAFGGGSTATLYGLDKAAGRLVTLSSPNGGTLQTVGPLGVSLNTALSSIGTDFTSGNGSGTLYLTKSVLTGPFAATTVLYTLNPATGAATQIGTVGPANGLAFVSDIAVARQIVSATHSRSELAASVSVYPNPARNFVALNVELPRSGRVALRVFDALGRSVAAQAPEQLASGPHTLRWESSNVKAGLYQLCLTMDEQVVASRRVVVTP